MYTSLWWSVWWPWILLWAATASCLIALGGLGWREWRRWRRWRRRHRGLARVCVYLHEKIVISQYKAGGHEPALSREVVKKTSRGLQILSWLGISAGGSTETTTKYLQETDPIIAIGVLLDVLEHENALIRVDLSTGSVRDNEALQSFLERHQSDTGRGRRSKPCQFRLQDLRLDQDFFVLVNGQFHQSNRSATSVAAEARPTPVELVAPFGDEEADPDEPHVRLVCLPEGLSDTVPNGIFGASCLGKVSTWNAQTARLDLQAIALFR